MISARVPKVWDMAIRWCKCRQRWIDRVYDKHLKALNNNCMASKEANNNKKSEIVKNILNPKKTKFEDTIRYDQMVQYNEEEQEFWKPVIAWVHFFAEKYPYWENFVNVRSRGYGKTKSEIAKDLATTQHVNEDIAIFFVNSL